MGESGHYSDLAASYERLKTEHQKLEQDHQQLKKGWAAAMKLLQDEFAWTFTLHDGVGVKVGFRVPEGVTFGPQHAQAFAKILQSVVENYSPKQGGQEREN